MAEWRGDGVIERGNVEERTQGRTAQRHTELEVYQRAFSAAMRLFELSKGFPAEERYALTDQLRRSSRSVCANLAEAWRKRRYEASFRSKLCDCEAEAAETQTWIQFASRCGYLPPDLTDQLTGEYDIMLGMLVRMLHQAHTWTL